MIVAKSKPTTMNLAVSVSTSSSTVNSPIASNEFSRMATYAYLDVSRGKLVTTEEDREHLNYPQDSVITWKLVPQDIQELQETQETRKPKAMTKIGHTQSPYFIKLCASHGEGLLDRETKIWSKPDGTNERLRCETSFLVYIYVCHCSSKI